MQRIIVLSTVATPAQATKIADDLVTRRLAACVNIIPVLSLYRWKGKLARERECLMIIKTTSKALPRIKGRILALHPYSLPEIVSIKIDNGYNAYLKWIDRMVTP